jgi:hypothetical protein
MAVMAPARCTAVTAKAVSLAQVRLTSISRLDILNVTLQDHGPTVSRKGRTPV